MSIHDVLRLFMAVLGMLLILAMGKTWFYVMKQETVFGWKKLLGTGLAETLVRLDPENGWKEAQKRRESVPERDGPGDFLADLFVFGNPLAQYPRKQRNEETKGSDPAYEEYKEAQAVRQEYQYFLLYGDENSKASYGEEVRGGSEAEGAAGRESGMETEESLLAVDP